MLLSLVHGRAHVAVQPVLAAEPQWRWWGQTGVVQGLCATVGGAGHYVNARSECSRCNSCLSKCYVLHFLAMRVTVFAPHLPAAACPSMHIVVQQNRHSSPLHMTYRHELACTNVMIRWDVPQKGLLCRMSNVSSNVYTCMEVAWSTDPSLIESMRAVCIHACMQRSHILVKAVTVRYCDLRRLLQAHARAHTTR